MEIKRTDVLRQIAESQELKETIPSETSAKPQQTSREEDLLEKIGDARSAFDDIHAISDANDAKLEELNATEEKIAKERDNAEMMFGISVVSAAVAFGGAASGIGASAASAISGSVNAERIAHLRSVVAGAAQSLSSSDLKIPDEFLSKVKEAIHELKEEKQELKNLIADIDERIQKLQDEKKKIESVVEKQKQAAYDSFKIDDQIPAPALSSIQKLLDDLLEQLSK